MRKSLLIMCAAVCLGPAVFGQALTQADRDQGVKYLEQTRDAIIAATKDLSEAQWKFKAAPDKWSVAETLEHIALAEDYIFGAAESTEKTGPAGAPDRDFAKIDAMILQRTPDRSAKKQAPPPMVPTGRWTPAETLDHFLKSRARTIEFLKTTPDLREHVSDGPFGSMDAFEWLIFIGAHSERHTKQILEVEASPGFPKN
jgi:hypothetical protein